MKTRQSPRLKHYNYAQAGAYFITLVAHQRKPLLGEILAGELIPAPLAELAFQHWHQLPRRHSTLSLDEMVMMPNHLHGILWLSGDNSHQLMKIINNYKAGVTREFRPPATIWQRGFYDRVIRDETELNTIRHYIKDNPLRWHGDRLNYR